MALALDILSWLLLVVGGALLVIGAVGVLRLPDLFTRLHAASIVDTLGVALVLLGLALQAPDVIVFLKLALILVFLVVTTPAASHALAKAALHAGQRPVLHRDEEDASSKL